MSNSEVVRSHRLKTVGFPFHSSRKSIGSGTDTHITEMRLFQQLTRRTALTGLASPRLSSQIPSTRLWQRNFGATAAAAQQAALDASKLQITKTSTPKELTPNNELVFGATFTGTYLLLQRETHFGDF
jgi:hypothetical protein